MGGFFLKTIRCYKLFMNKKTKKAVVVGAGPSGVSAAYELSKQNIETQIIEKYNTVGGLARTISFKNLRFDVGPHRFFTYNKEVENLYLRILGSDAIEVKRQTRILYNKKLFDYPLSPLGTITKIGLIGAILILVSYLIAIFNKIILRKKPKNFEEWVELNFGKNLYKKFFKSYTEKVWGIKCSKISKDWAAQRIKNLSFIGVILNPIIKKFRKKKIKTLVDQFWYPRLGAGIFYEKLLKKMNGNNVKVSFNEEFLKINHENEKIISITSKNKQGELKNTQYDYYFISSPFTKIIENLRPKAPKEILECVNQLNYRHHIGVKLIISGKIFKDNWIYIHDPNVKMARVSNYLNFSKFMSENSDLNPVTVEYFCFNSDEVWKKSDSELINLAEKELRQTQLIKEENIVKDGFIVRSLDAYPVIAMGYEKNVNKIREYISKFKNLFPIGRSGMFKYNNQDHAIATGMYAARNLISEGKKIDIWKINSEGVYLEGNIDKDTQKL